jgi:hypothetical protein
MNDTNVIAMTPQTPMTMSNPDGVREVIVNGCAFDVRRDDELGG